MSYYIQSKSTNSTSATPLSVAFTSAVTLGDTVIAVIMGEGSAPTGPSVTDSQGNSYTLNKTFNFSVSSIWVYSALVGVTGSLTATVTMATYGGDLYLMIGEYLCPAVIGANNTLSGTGTSYTVPSVSSASSGLVICAVFSQSFSGATFGFSADWTIRQTSSNGSNGDCGCFADISGTGGTYGGETLTVSPANHVGMTVTVIGPPPPTSLIQRGNVDIDQLNPVIMSGQYTGGQLATWRGNSAVGHLVSIDAFGNLVDSQIAGGPLGSGGAFAPKGTILVSTGSAWAQLPVGSNGQVLTADSTQADGVKWA